MRTLAIRSVPLSKETADSWRASGVTFRRRSRERVWDPRFHDGNYNAVLNLGNLDMDFRDVPVPIFNAPELIRQISTPYALRKSLPKFLPETTVQGPHWHKRAGMKGQGKVFHDRFLGECSVLSGDMQAHVDGEEYRILTVNGAVVQATKKHGAAPNFEFEWVGIQGIQKGGFIPLLKEATEAIAHWGNSVIGWDVIHDGSKPFIIEANTSPGVNDATAKRVVEQMRRIIT